MGFELANLRILNLLYSITLGSTTARYLRVPTVAALSVASICRKYDTERSSEMSTRTRQYCRYVIGDNESGLAGLITFSMVFFGWLQHTCAYSRVQYVR